MSFIGDGLYLEGHPEEWVTSEPLEPITEGAIYGIVLEIEEMRQGQIFVWIGGTRSAPFSSVGRHEFKLRTDATKQELGLQGVGAIAFVTGLSIRRVILPPL